MTSSDKHKSVTTALTSAKIVRRQVLNQILELITKDEAKSRRGSIIWSEVGSIERQHDYLCRILAELKKPNSH